MVCSRVEVELIRQHEQEAEEKDGNSTNETLSIDKYK